MSVLGRMGRAAQGAMSMADSMSRLREQEMQNEQTAVNMRRAQADEAERKRMANALRNMQQAQPQTAPQQGATVSYAPQAEAPAPTKPAPVTGGDAPTKPTAPKVLEQPQNTQDSWMYRQGLHDADARLKELRSQYEKAATGPDYVKVPSLQAGHEQAANDRAVYYAVAGDALRKVGGIPAAIQHSLTGGVLGKPLSSVEEKAPAVADENIANRKARFNGVGSGSGGDRKAIAEEITRLEKLRGAFQKGVDMYAAAPQAQSAAKPNAVVGNVAPNSKQLQADADAAKLRNYANMISEALGPNTATSITPELLAQFSAAESSGNENAVSPKGARGEFQVMPDTFNFVNGQFYNNKLKWNDPWSQKIAGVRYMHYLDQSLGLGGDPQLIASAYIQGPAGFKKYGAVNNRSDGVGTVAQYVNKFGGQGGTQVAAAPQQNGQQTQVAAAPQQPAPTMMAGNYQMGATAPWIEDQQLDYQMRLNNLIAQNSDDPQVIMKAQLDNQELQVRKQGSHLYAISNAAARGNPQALQELVGAYSSYTGTPFTVVPMSDGSVVLATQGQDGKLVPASQPMPMQQLVGSITGSVVPAVRNQLIAINAKRAEAMATKAPDMLIQSSKNQTAMRLSDDKWRSTERDTDVRALAEVTKARIAAGKGSAPGVYQNQYDGSTIIQKNGQFFRVIPASTDPQSGLQYPEQVVQIPVPQGADLSAGIDPSTMVAGEVVPQSQETTDPLLAYIQ